jgi:hypothetical protein
MRRCNPHSPRSRCDGRSGPAPENRLPRTRETPCTNVRQHWKNRRSGAVRVARTRVVSAFTRFWTLKSEAPLPITTSDGRNERAARNAADIAKTSHAAAGRSERPSHPQTVRVPRRPPRSPPSFATLHDTRRCRAFRRRRRHPRAISAPIPNRNHRGPHPPGSGAVHGRPPQRLITP